MKDTPRHEPNPKFGQVTAPVPIGLAATMLGVSVDTVRRWADDGIINSNRTVGGQRRFELTEIERVKRGEPREQGAAAS